MLYIFTTNCMLVRPTSCFTTRKSKLAGPSASLRTHISKFSWIGLLIIQWNLETLVGSRNHLKSILKERALPNLGSMAQTLKPSGPPCRNPARDFNPLRKSHNPADSEVVPSWPLRPRSTVHGFHLVHRRSAPSGLHHQDFHRLH